MFIDEELPHHSGAVERGIQFALVDVYLCSRKIRQAAGVVEVHVGQQDMLHIIGGVSQRLHLVQRRLVDVIEQANDHVKGTHHRGRPGDILCAVAGIDEDQALAGVNQQTVSAAPPTRAGTSGLCRRGAAY